MALGALTSNPLAKVGLGIAGTVVGGGIGIANQDFIAQFLSGDMSDNAFQAELGKRVLDPQKFSNEFLLPTMQARINLGLDGREDSEGRAISSSRVLDSFSSEAARSMGYDSVIVGQLIGAGLSSMRPDLSPGNDVDAARFIDTIANLEGFGVSKESGVGLLSTISAAGSEDFRETLARLAFASSEDGEITNYTMNVLVPALAKVVESRSIQNISRNSELVERETAGLFSFFKNSDTNLGKMLGANPEMMSRVFDMLGQVQESALQDPALMLFLNRMGVSFADVIGGDPRALLEPMGLFSQYADYDVSGNINLDSMASISSLVGFLQATGVGVTSGTLNIASEMFSAMEQSRMTGSEFSGEGFMERLRMESPEHQLGEAFRQFADRMTAITGSEGAEVTRNIVDETSKFFDLMSQNANSMLALQDGVRSVLGDSRAIGRSVAEAGIKILEQLSKVTNVDMSERITDLKRDILSSEVGSNLEKRQIIEDLPPEAVNSLFTNSSKSLGGGLLVNPESYRDGGGYQVDYSRFFALADVEENPRDLARNRALQQALREGGDFNEALPFTHLLNPLRDIDSFTDEFYTNINTLIGSLGNESHAFRVNAGGNVLSFFSREQISNIDANQLSNYQAYVINQSVLEGNKLTGTDAIKFNNDLRPVQEHWGFATGGYTGTGTRLEPVGVVHGGEYVISDNNVSGNLQTLQRMQAGEKMDEFSPFDTTVNSGGDTIRVTLEFSNTNPEEIINAARMSARAMLRDERLL